MMEDNSTPSSEPSNAPAEPGPPPESVAPPESAPSRPPLPTDHIGDTHYAGRHFEPHEPYIRLSRNWGDPPPSESDEG